MSKKKLSAAEKSAILQEIESGHSGIKGAIGLAICTHNRSCLPCRLGPANGLFTKATRIFDRIMRVD